ncbi:MgtC/SapB family protein [Gluconobacter vitians]|uniref:MgtC/SapB family protein n=1 Tax=Gluconobacter vitians TaxID=2728102 RepID=UPI001D178C58|nr:MgtC/SapB family protein [Gluconobacter vitians]
MHSLSLSDGWQDVMVRLAAALITGMVFGLNRDEHQRAAGLRTTTLVCLAACLAMVDANLLLQTGGKTAGSFATLDLMRLPLGILSGMGFIGAGAILRRGNIIHGVTTAATLWIVTVLGLCFGGGQILLGLTGAGLGFAVLSGLKYVERYLPQRQRCMLVFKTRHQDSGWHYILKKCAEHSVHIKQRQARYQNDEQTAEIHLELSWQNRTAMLDPLFLQSLNDHPDILWLDWQSLEMEE